MKPESERQGPPRLRARREPASASAPGAEPQLPPRGRGLDGTQRAPRHVGPPPL